jgi:hypothetical protein
LHSRHRLAEDAQFGLLRRPVAGAARDRLGTAEDQETAALQTALEDAKGPCLQCLAKVDEDVAADQQLRFEEGVVGDEVVLGELDRRQAVAASR